MHRCAAPPSCLKHIAGFQRNCIATGAMSVAQRQGVPRIYLASSGEVIITT